MHTIAFQITAHTPPIQPHIYLADARWTRVSLPCAMGLLLLKVAVFATKRVIFIIHTMQFIAQQLNNKLNNSTFVDTIFQPPNKKHFSILNGFFHEKKRTFFYDKSNWKTHTSQKQAYSIKRMKRRKKPWSHVNNKQMLNACLIGEIKRSLGNFSDQLFVCSVFNRTNE